MHTYLSRKKKLFFILSLFFVIVIRAQESGIDQRWVNIFLDGNQTYNNPYMKPIFKISTSNKIGRPRNKTIIFQISIYTETTTDPTDTTMSTGDGTAYTNPEQNKTAYTRPKRNKTYQSTSEIPKLDSKMYIRPEFNETMEIIYKIPGQFDVIRPIYNKTNELYKEPKQNKTTTILNDKTSYTTHNGTTYTRLKQRVGVTHRVPIYKTKPCVQQGTCNRTSSKRPEYYGGLYKRNLTVKRPVINDTKLLKFL